MSSRQRTLLTTATCLLMAVAISALALGGYSPWVAVLGGAWLGLAPPALLFGVLNAVAPARIIRWRESAMSTNTGYRKVVGDWFSKRMAIVGPSPWESSIARNRVRALGIYQIVFWLVGGAMLLLLLLDR